MVHNFAALACQIIEFISIFIIIVGVATASYRVAKLSFDRLTGKRPKDKDAMIHLRLSFESTLMLGLQFLMAADIIGTISNPDLQGVIIVSVIVILRVILSFTLSREVAEIDRQKRENEKYEMEHGTIQDSGVLIAGAKEDNLKG